MNDTYEYKTIRKVSSQKDEEELNKLGAKGFRIHSRSDQVFLMEKKSPDSVWRIPGPAGPLKEAICELIWAVKALEVEDLGSPEREAARLEYWRLFGKVNEMIEPEEYIKVPEED